MLSSTTIDSSSLSWWDELLLNSALAYADNTIGRNISVTPEPVELHPVFNPAAQRSVEYAYQNG